MLTRRAYVSSTSELEELRAAARRLLSRYHFEDRGMEDSDYAAHPDLVAKCTGDAAAAELLILIVDGRYGDPYPEHDHKSMVELEYEAAVRAGRIVLAFFGAQSVDDEMLRRFRQRLVDDRRLVGEFTTAADFSLKLENALAGWQRTILEQERDLGGGADTLSFALRAYLTGIVQESEAFAKLYVPLAARTTKHDRTDAPEDAMFDAAASHPGGGARTSMREVELDDVWDALHEHRQFYLLGEPGAGKSISLRALEIEGARRFLSDPRSPFPLRVDQAQWQAESEEFAAFVAGQLRAKVGVLVTLPPSRLLLLVDGVIDSAGARYDRLERVEAWLKANRACKAALAVRGQRAFERELPVVRLKRLDRPRVLELVRKRLGEADGRGLLDRITRLSDAEGKRSDIEKLLENPFNLGLICQLQRAADLPSSRGELLRAVVSTAHGRESRRAAERPSWDAFIEVMGKISIAMIRGRAGLTAKKSWLKRIMGSEKTMRELLSLAIDCDIVTESGAMTVDFRHRLYMEYFAAEYLRSVPARLHDVLEAPVYHGGKRQSSRFDEVLETVVQIDTDPESGANIIKTIADYDPFLAASCLAFVSDQPSKKRAAEEAVVQALVGRFGDAETTENAIAALAQLGVPAVAGLRRALKDEKHFVRRSVVRALAQIHDADAIDGVLAALADGYRWVRTDTKDAIRRFSEPFRVLLLRCVESRRASWQGTAEGCAILDALADLINDLPADYAAALAAAAGIEIEAADEQQERPAAPQQPAVELEPELTDEEEIAAARSGTSSWGFQWLPEWQVEHSPEQAAAGRAWLRVASLRDAGWPYVWCALWAAEPGDGELEWLVRDWLNRVSPRARSWSHVWQELHRVRRDDEAHLVRGANWLEAVGADQFGWNHVWRALWVADWKREELRRLGYWWMEAADANVDESWSVVWNTFWNGGEDKVRLTEIARTWMTQADVASHSWGFVWPSLWAEHAGDESLIEIAMNWIRHAPASHPGWGRIWPAVWQHTHRHADAERAGRRWVREAGPDHGAWGFIWTPLWKATRNDADLEEAGRTWLTAAQPSHHAWSHLWVALWDRLRPDTSLFDLGREWLATAGEHTGWTFVWVRILEAAPGDRALLDAGVTRLEQRPIHDDGWWAIWKALWDFGGDREWLAPLGRTWLRSHGRNSSGFSFVWERLWVRDAQAPEWRAIALEWLKTHFRESTWSYVAEPLARFDPADPELSAIARGFVETTKPSSKNWPAAWRIVADAAGIDDALLQHGQSYVVNHAATANGWPRVWCRLPIKEGDPLLGRGWMLMEGKHFKRRSWPDVWGVLWDGEPLQRRQLAELAVDWLITHDGKTAARIGRWDDVRGLLRADDHTRRAALDQWVR